jgi:hypothetical protein
VFEKRPYFHPKNVQLIAQMFQLEYGNYIKKWAKWLQYSARPMHFTITIRYTDWWNWEENRPLELQNLSRSRHFKIPNTVKTFTIEFETRFGKKSELDRIINEGVGKVPPVIDWKFTTDSLAIKGNGQVVTDENTPGAGKVLVWDGVLRADPYIGSASIGCREHPAGEHEKHMKCIPTNKYHDRKDNGGEENLKEGEMLYYIVKVVFVPEKRPGSMSTAAHRGSDASLSTFASSPWASPRRESNVSQLMSPFSASPVGSTPTTSYFPPPLSFVRRESDMTAPNMSPPSRAGGGLFGDGGYFGDAIGHSRTNSSAATGNTFTSGSLLTPLRTNTHSSDVMSLQSPVSDDADSLYA